MVERRPARGAVVVSEGLQHADLDSAEAAAAGEDERRGHHVTSMVNARGSVPGRTGHGRAPRRASGREAVGELLDDPVGERVGHVEDVEVDAVVLGDVGGPVALQAGGRFRQGLVEVGSHHLSQGVD